MIVQNRTPARIMAKNIDPIEYLSLSRVKTQNIKIKKVNISMAILGVLGFPTHCSLVEADAV